MTEEKEEDANECLRFVSLKLVFALFCADVLEPMEKKLFEIMMKKKLSFKLFEDFEANCGRSNLSVRTYFASKISDVVQLISVQYVTERPVLHGAGVATIERVLVYFQPKE